MLSHFEKEKHFCGKIWVNLKHRFLKRERVERGRQFSLTHICQDMNDSFVNDWQTNKQIQQKLWWEAFVLRLKNGNCSIKILIVIVPDPRNLVCYHQVLAIWGLILPVDFFHEQWEVLGVVADLQISLSGTATVSILKKLILELNRIVFGFEYLKKTTSYFTSKA